MKFLAVAVMALLCVVADAGLYVRWGRTKCDNDAVPMYTGYTVTEHYNAVGGGRNYLCLADKPQWGSQVGGTKTWASGLHGVQYWFGPEYTNGHPFSYANYNNQDINFRSAPCTLCYTPRIDVTMIPGLQTCPGDMITEYSGYVVSNDYRNYPGEHICLDQAPEVAAAGVYKSNEAFMIPSITICGSLPCPAPYAQYNQVTCSVCSI